MATNVTPPRVTAPPGTGPWMRWVEAAVKSLAATSSVPKTPTIVKADVIRPGAQALDVTLTGSLIQSAPQGANVPRWWGDPAGIHFSRADGTKTIDLDTVSGTASISGIIRSGPANSTPRVEINNALWTSGFFGIRFYDDSGNAGVPELKAYDSSGSVYLTSGEVVQSNTGHGELWMGVGGAYSLQSSYGTIRSGVTSLTTSDAHRGVRLWAGDTSDNTQSTSSYSAGVDVIGSESADDMSVWRYMTGTFSRARLTLRQDGSVVLVYVVPNGSASNDAFSLQRYDSSTGTLYYVIRDIANAGLYIYHANGIQIQNNTNVSGNLAVSGSISAGSFSGLTPSPTGMLAPWAGGPGSPPSGWLLCDGSAVSRTTYSALFAVTSTTFGVGDGSTTFNLPDLRGRVIVGYNASDTDFNATGKVGGAKVVTHSHTMSAAFAEISVTAAAQYLVMNRITTASWSTNIALSGGTGVGGGSFSSSQTVGATIGGTTDGASPSVVQPYMAMGYIIKT